MPNLKWEVESKMFEKKKYFIYLNKYFHKTLSDKPGRDLICIHRNLYRLDRFWHHKECKPFYVWATLEISDDGSKQHFLKSSACKWAQYSYRAAQCSIINAWWIHHVWQKQKENKCTCINKIQTITRKSNELSVLNASFMCVIMVLNNHRNYTQHKNLL